MSADGFASGGLVPPGSGDRLLAALSGGCPASTVPSGAELRSLRETILTVALASVVPCPVDDRPIVNVWSPRYLGGRPGSDW